MKIFLINAALILFVVTSLTGCGASRISVKPSTDSLESLEHSATGTVHVTTTTKGLEVVPYDKEPGTTLISPPVPIVHSKVYFTEDDVISIVNASSIDAIRQAGFTITVQPSSDKADYDVAIKVKSVVAVSKRNYFPLKTMEDIAIGDRGNREDNLLMGAFNNTFSGAVIAVVTFTNNKTKATFAHVVSGADYSSLYTNDGCVEHAITGALKKYKINLVKALEAFQQGLLK